MTPSQKHNPLAMKGMITTPHYLASQAGLHVLRSGGSAVDAAIAASAALCVVYPQMCSLGGDSFWLIYNAARGEMKGLNASGRAGEEVSIAAFSTRGMKKVPSRGPLAAITVPGVVSGWEQARSYAHESLGGAFSWAELLDPALSLATDGFPISHSLAEWIRIDTDLTDRTNRCLQRFAGFAEVFCPNGRALRTGEILRQPNLANSLALIAEHGPKEFYSGSIARQLVDSLRDVGGLLTLKDFAQHKADWVDPISVPYRDCMAYNLPPNSQGMASLAILALLNNFTVRSLDPLSADYVHLIAEATKLAFLDRDQYLTDPDFADIPVQELLSKDYAAKQAARISMQHTQDYTQPLDPNGDTIWMGVIDRFGNAVSLIQSVYYDFGSGILPGTTGIIMQNRGCFFSLDPQHVNRLEPRKRSFHTLNPAMLLHKGRPLLIYGTMGGEGQPQTQAALVTRILDFGMTPQEAIDAPRWLLGRSWGQASNSLKIEGRFSQAVEESLRQRGHTVERVEDYADCMGHAGAILINQDNGVYQGGTDPRSDGLACGY